MDPSPAIVRLIRRHLFNDSFPQLLIDSDTVKKCFLCPFLRRLFNGSYGKCVLDVLDEREEILVLVISMNKIKNQHFKFTSDDN